jgi:hypothetical protein
MSKKNWRRVGSSYFITLVLSAALLSNIFGQTPKPAASVNTKSAAVREATAEVLQETSELRQLPVLRKVESGAQSRAEIEQMLIRSLDEDSSPEELRAAETLLIKLGLVPAGFQMRPFIISLLTEQVAGYYDPKTQRFYLADWIDLDGQKPVISHELTHALQDQHFNLRRFQKWPKGDSDAELAAQSLVEGDATVAMTQYVLRNPLRALAMMRSMQAGGNPTEQIDKAPRALRESLLFPYEKGMLWATQLYRKGGWKLVSQAFTDLPKSTEQILHPEKYFAREEPVKVEIADLAPLLGKGWRRTDYDVNGEWGYFLVLDVFLNAQDDSLKAAAGWGGDRYALYEGATKGQVLVAQLTTWDTPEDATEFFAAYVKRTNLRYGVSPDAGTRTKETESSFRLRTNEGAVLVERRGARIAILEGVPAAADERKLMDAVWGRN